MRNFEKKNMSRLFTGANHVSCVCLFICLFFFFLLLLVLLFIDSLNNEATGGKKIQTCQSWFMKLKEKRSEIFKSFVLHTRFPRPSFFFCLSTKINIQLSLIRGFHRGPPLPAIYKSSVSDTTIGWLLNCFPFFFFFFRTHFIRPCLVNGKIVSHFFFLLFPHWRDVLPFPVCDECQLRRRRRKKKENVTSWVKKGGRSLIKEEKKMGRPFIIGLVGFFVRSLFALSRPHIHTTTH